MAFKQLVYCDLLFKIGIFTIHTQVCSCIFVYVRLNGNAHAFENKRRSCPCVCVFALLQANVGCGCAFASIRLFCVCVCVFHLKSKVIFQVCPFSIINILIFEFTLSIVTPLKKGLLKIFNTLIHIHYTFCSDAVTNINTG